MDKQVQDDLLGDVKDFLDEDTQKCVGTFYMDLLEPENPASAWISDSKLMKLFSELPPHYIILLEDVDAAGMGQNNSTSAITLSGLLNVLDGISSQEGRVLVMTTNHIEHLDEALIRPGRADKKVLLIRRFPLNFFNTVFKQTADHKESKHKFGDETIERLANDFASKMPDQVFSPAEVLSFLLEQKNSPFSAVTSVENWVAKTKAGSQLKREGSWVQEGH
ncbi:hypothetical protein N7537_010355 [Penicillium hordei]|uniref:ATPase AAA-type core domain-containing protein n=1 Tax=Penicillium hordei TaxID=40994 RepID=A0AAD6DUS8_9EURO|nr:uncharacterized protein N7537_010355 [Penicillium hordei]KAJ5593451.1 hypothetical protein N7537_010355 [Penicillium hordei]